MAGGTACRGPITWPSSGRGSSPVQTIRPGPQGQSVLEAGPDGWVGAPGSARTRAEVRRPRRTGSARTRGTQRTNSISTSFKYGSTLTPDLPTIAAPSVAPGNDPRFIASADRLDRHEQQASPVGAGRRRRPGRGREADEAREVTERAIACRQGKQKTERLLAGSR